MFPKDLVNAPREFAERFFDVRRFTEMPRGGHFAAHEEPVHLRAVQLQRRVHQRRAAGVDVVGLRHGGPSP